MNLKNNEGYELLISSILSLQTREDCVNLLDDLLTKKEIDDITQRLVVAKMLSEQVVYNKIVEETGASTATISRVNRAYLYGSGGYKKALEALAGEQDASEAL